VYLKIGSLPPFDVVLGVNLDVPSGGAAYMNGGRCVMMLYTDAQRRDDAHFKQLVAQQLGHCFQAATFPNQEKVPYAARRWREDGLALYLGNLVYPAVNAEWDMVPFVQEVDQAGSLLEWSAGAFLWWQFLADRLGWPGIEKLVLSLPVSGDLSDQAAAVAIAPGVTDLYGEFAKAYVDGTIKDTSGVTIPTRWAPTDQEEHAAIAQAGPWSADDLMPFQLTHRLLVVAGIDQATLAFTGSPGVAVVTRPESGATWGALPSAFPADCASDNRLVVLIYATSVTGGAHSDLGISDVKSSGCS
jgi:hypothetical protein